MKKFFAIPMFLFVCLGLLFSFNNAMAYDFHDRPDYPTGTDAFSQWVNTADEERIFFFDSAQHYAWIQQGGSPGAVGLYATCGGSSPCIWPMYGYSSPCKAFVYSSGSWSCDTNFSGGAVVKLYMSSTSWGDHVLTSVDLHNLGSPYNLLLETNWFPPATPLSFPLNKDCSGIPCTPYTAPVSAVMDQTTLGTGAIYGAGENSAVETFEGEVGDVGPYSGSTCYRKSDNSAFGISFNYVGTAGTGGAYYVCYDAHPGYDYPATSGTDINAPANGTLCVATSTTQQPYPADVWRDTTHCPYSTVGSTSWSGYHTFYIIHEGLYINGATNDYMTVFLHSDDLENSVRDDIEQNGYSQVTKDQHIAESGDTGSSGSYHMHLEVYKKNGENWDRVDPYGDGTNNILWE